MFPAQRFFAKGVAFCSLAGAGCPRPGRVPGWGAGIEQVRALSRMWAAGKLADFRQFISGKLYSCICSLWEGRKKTRGK